MTDRELYEYSGKCEALCRNVDVVDKELYNEYGVKRGLRDVNGHGVLTGITNISKIISSEIIDGKEVPCDGQLWYRGYNVIDMVKDFGFKRFGFEEIAYLLLFGDLPDVSQLEEFKSALASLNHLPTNFTRDVIMKAPSHDIMNSMTKSVLTLASYDDGDVSDLSIPNVLRQCLALISEFPMLAAYGYCAYNHYEKDESMYIHRPDPELSTAENLLRMLRPDRKYTQLEAQVLDAETPDRGQHLADDHIAFTEAVMEGDGHAVLQAAGLDGIFQRGQQLGPGFGTQGRAAFGDHRRQIIDRLADPHERLNDVIADLFGKFTSYCIDHSPFPPLHVDAGGSCLRQRGLRAKLHGLVDHIAAQGNGAFMLSLAFFDRGQHAERVVDLLLAGGESGVDHVHLTGMHHRLAVEAQVPGQLHVFL